MKQKAGAPAGDNITTRPRAPKGKISGMGGMGGGMGGGMLGGAGHGQLQAGGIGSGPSAQPLPRSMRRRPQQPRGAAQRPAAATAGPAARTNARAAHGEGFVSAINGVDLSAIPFSTVQPNPTRGSENKAFGGGSGGPPADWKDSHGGLGGFGISPAKSRYHRLEGVNSLNIQLQTAPNDYQRALPGPAGGEIAFHSLGVEPELVLPSSIAPATIEDSRQQCSAIGSRSVL